MLILCFPQKSWKDEVVVDTKTEPKKREIVAADFQDRVVHHLLYNYIAPLLYQLSFPTVI